MRLIDGETSPIAEILRRSILDAEIALARRALSGWPAYPFRMTAEAPKLLAHSSGGLLSEGSLFIEKLTNVCWIEIIGASKCSDGLEP